MKVKYNGIAYDFDLISDHVEPLTHKKLLVAFVEDSNDVWAVLDDKQVTKACNQLQAYYTLLDMPVRWISVVDSVGFRNPATAYMGTSPDCYKV